MFFCPGIQKNPGSVNVYAPGRNLRGTTRHSMISHCTRRIQKIYIPDHDNGVSRNSLRYGENAVFFGNSAPIRDSPGRLYLLTPAADSLKKVMS